MFLAVGIAKNQCNIQLRVFGSILKKMSQFYLYPVTVAAF